MYCHEPLESGRGPSSLELTEEEQKQFDSVHSQVDQGVDSDCEDDNTAYSDEYIVDKVRQEYSL